MTPERLAAIEMRSHSLAYATSDRVELLAEVKRLNTELAAALAKLEEAQR